MRNEIARGNWQFSVNRMGQKANWPIANTCFSDNVNRRKTNRDLKELNQLLSLTSDVNRIPASDKALRICMVPDSSAFSAIKVKAEMQYICCKIKC